jgi:alginate O-acetyltransferase complex protein AlgI
MVFSSLTFIFLFLPIVIVFYYLAPGRKTKNLVLLVFSFVFYSWGEPIYILLMVISTLNDFFFAKKVEKAKERNQQSNAKFFLAVSIIVNLSLLGFFKYAGFLINNINSIFDTGLNIPKLALPIGISFYTFQTMSYSIDVFKGKVKAQKKLLPLATYVALFPQLIAGPIVRYITIETELVARKESTKLVAEGLRRFIIGLGKKVIIANQMAIIADTVFSGSPGEHSTIIIWIAAIAFSFQIYFDFSGYSDMAIGLGKIFGFNFLENFNYPYISTSITDFWRRWHISLSTWFKDYVYIPLGGNRVKKLKVLRNIIIVWFLTGLWHGANWNFIIWGLYYGLLLLIEKFLLNKILLKTPVIIKRFYTILLLIVGWVIFKVENLNNMSVFLKRMFTYNSLSYKQLLFEYQDILQAAPFYIIAIIACTPLFKKINNKSGSEKLLNKVVYDTFLIIILAVSIIFLVGETYNPFIYFRF